MSVRIIYRITWITFACILVAMIVVYRSQPLAAVQPGPLTGYAMEDGSIALQYPDGWKPHELSMNSSIAEVEFKPTETVRFYVKCDFAGSILADLARAGAAPPVPIPGIGESVPGSGGRIAAGGIETAPGGPGETVPGGGGPAGGSNQDAPQKTGIETIHAMQGALMAKKSTYDGLQDGQTNKIQVSGLDALATDFTFLGKTLGSLAMTGRRITALTTERRVSIVCTCPTKEISVYGPVFEKMVASLKFTSGGK